MIVADTGPIIAYARIGRLDLLRQVVGELVIPEAVYEELMSQGHKDTRGRVLPRSQAQHGSSGAP